MRNGVYVKDYSVDGKLQKLPEELKEGAELIRGYSEFMRVLPKKVSARKKAQYEQKNRQTPSRKVRHGHLVQPIPEKNVKNHDQPPDLSHYPVAPNSPYPIICFSIPDIRYVILRYLTIDCPAKHTCNIPRPKTKPSATQRGRFCTQQAFSSVS